MVKLFPFIFLQLSIFFLDSLNEVPYPEGYLQWTCVKTSVVRAGKFHRIYANDIAMSGLDTGKFSEGSIWVFDVIEAEDKNGEVIEGRRQAVDVMVKNSSVYTKTGGWGFEEFNENSRTERNIMDKAEARCFIGCHANKGANDFVFSSYQK